MKDICTQILETVPILLNLDLEPDKVFETILNEYLKIFNADLATVLYISGSGLEIKYSKGASISDFKNVDSTGLQIRKFIKSKAPSFGCSSKDSNSILSELGLQINKEHSYMALPLMIKSALFGMILIAKYEKNAFTQDSTDAANALAGVCSYSVKDSELANVFKLQQKALRDSIIDKTKAYELIKEQNEKIKESDRLKSEFLANMSHELRTPLNAIIGFSEALQLKIFGTLNPKQEEYIEDIYTSGVHLLGMINDLLDISKIEANAMRLAKSKFDVLKAVNEVNNIVKALANKKKITVSLNCKSKNIEIYADEQKFHQIMYNLLSNSIKFTDEGGNVEVGLSKSKDKLKVYVKDNGIGIDEKYHGKIFAKFQQVDSSYTRKQSSTGLGLTITKELIEMHGGTINLESRLNQGTTFTFEIPIKAS